VLATLVLPAVQAEAMRLFLTEVAHRPADEFMGRVLDGAGGHRAQPLPVPGSMRLLSLPPWSPPLNPTEQVWDEGRENYLANRRFETMDQLDHQLVTGLAAWETNMPPMASLTGFAWITCVPLKAN
jgi:hypothetical protein